jgi:hypothetical protein
MEKLSCGRRKTALQWTNPWVNEMAKWVVYELKASCNLVPDEAPSNMVTHKKVYYEILLTNVSYFNRISYALMTMYISTFIYLISARNIPSAVCAEPPKDEQ